jgi:hypothetical protein
MILWRVGFNLSDFFVLGGGAKILFLQGVRGKCVRKMWWLVVG